MGLMGTLAKVAIGYAAARGVDKIAGSGGLSAMMSGDAGNLQEMMGKLTEGAPGDLQSMLGGLMGQAQAGGANMQDMMSSMMGQTPGQAQGGDGGGLLGQLGGGGAGLAGMMAARDGLAAAGGGTAVGGLLDQLGAAGAVPQEQEDTAGLMLRAVIQSAKADGQIDEAERAKIMEMIDGADPEDIAFVPAALEADVDPEALAADTPAAVRPQVYSMALMAIRVDTAGEAQYLDALARAMELDQATVNTLHAQMGGAPLYS